jgi:undecaprenyl diphosphate synthase
MIHKFFKKSTNESACAFPIDETNLPKHVAIIMDGNGRWAKKRRMPRGYGHRAGAETLKKIVRAASDIGIKVLTVYAFSTENWKRPQEEVSLLMSLIEEYVGKNILELNENNVIMRFIGNIAELSPTLQRVIRRAEENTATNTGLILNLAINYGGRDELVQAIHHLAVKVQQGELLPAEIDEAMVGHYLYTAPSTDVDLLIRPGADYRISNFLLWQVAYAEFWFTDLFWPDFTKDTLLDAIRSFQSRERRFGGLK